MYDELLFELHERDSTGLDWTYKMRQFALPKTEKPILDKGNYTLSRSANNFSNLIQEQLQILQYYPNLIPKV